MELQQLKYFAITAKYENMTMAAHELNIAQPAISQSIARLERELGVNLFIRQGRTIRLSPAGKYLKQQIPELLGAFARVKNELVRIAGEEQTHISLLIQSSSALVPEVLAAYRKLHPEIEFSLIYKADPSAGHDDTGGVEYDIRLASTDKAVGSKPVTDTSTGTLTGTLTDTPTGAGIGQGIVQGTDNFAGIHTGSSPSVILEEEILLISGSTSNSHANIGSGDYPKLKLASLSGSDFITLSVGHSLRTITDKYCTEVGFKPHFKYESDSPDMVRNMIRSKMGAAFYPAKTWGAVNDPGLGLYRIDGKPLRRFITLQINPQRSDNPDIRACFEFIRDYYSKL